MDDSDGSITFADGEVVLRADWVSECVAHLEDRARHVRAIEAGRNLGAKIRWLGRKNTLASSEDGPF